MTRKYESLFAGINKKKDPVPVILTAYSQPHVLQQRMKEENLKHGDRVTANLSPIRLEENFGKMVMYFCPMHSVEVCNKIEVGDGGSLPEEATIYDVKVPGDFKPGLYTMKNVELFSNGTLQVIAKSDTEFEAI